VALLISAGRSAIPCCRPGLAWKPGAPVETPSCGSTGGSANSHESRFSAAVPVDNGEASMDIIIGIDPSSELRRGTTALCLHDDG
jgi:hypothetical protein